MKGLKAYNARRTAAALAKPCGLTYDLLHEIRRAMLLREIRRAMRALRKAEGWIVREHRAEKRRRAQSGEWQAAAKIFGKS